MSAVWEGLLRHAEGLREHRSVPESAEQSNERVMRLIRPPSDAAIGKLSVDVAMLFLPAAVEMAPSADRGELAKIVATTWLMGVQAGIEAERGGEG